MNYETGEFGFLGNITAKKGISFLTVLSMVLSISTPFMLYPATVNADTTLPLVPTAVGNNDQWNVTPGNSTKVDAVNADDGDNSYVHEGSNNDAQTFSVAGAAIPLGATVNSVTLYAISKGTGGGSNPREFALRVENVSATDDGSTVLNAGSGYATFSRLMTTNPLTGTSWTISEVNSWTLKFGVVRKNGNGTIRVTQIYVIVDYNQPTTGSITVNKTAIGGDGTFDFTGDAGIFFILTADGTGTTTIDDLAPGEYTITETAQTGWDTEDNACTVTVTAGDTETCNFTNTKRGSITVVKDVVAPDGETDVDDDHTFQVTLDGDSQSNFSEDSSKTFENLIPDSYTIAEIGDPDFDLLSIGGDCAADGTINLAAGQEATCTITNKQKSASLTVKKIVTNHGIGDAMPSDFTMEVTGTNVSTPFFPGNEEGTTVTLNPGSYSVGEDPVDGYAMSLSADCSGTMSSNDTGKICTVTNSDIPTGQGAITVIKEVINDNGGQGEANDFTLTITPAEDDSMEVSNGQAEFLAPGNYTVGENPNPFNYTNTSISCTNGETTTTDGSVVLAEQEAWVCTVTNNDNAPSLTLNKVVVNDNGGTAVASDWTLTATGTTGFSGAGPTVSSDASFDQGTYALSETGGPSGYTASAWVCVGGTQDGTNITLGLGQSATCTITNDDQQGTLIVKKIVTNNDQGTSTADDFSFQVNGGEATPFVQDGENSLLGEKTVSVDAGTYTVTEVAVAGYTTTYANCSSVAVANGETETCTVTNNDIGDIDGDTVPDDIDNCPAVANTNQTDTDNDGAGDVCDSDDDGDGQTDTDETSCGSDPLNAQSESLDTDNDNIPNCVDTDDDNDTILDTTDNCPLDANTDQADNDADGTGNVCDSTPNGTPTSTGGGGSSVVLYAVTSSAGFGGTVNPSGIWQIIRGTDHTITITPNSGFQIADVLVDGNSVGPVTTYTFANVQAPHTLSANFSAVAGAFTSSTETPAPTQNPTPTAPSAPTEPVIPPYVPPAYTYQPSIGTGTGTVAPTPEPEVAGTSNEGETPEEIPTEEPTITEETDLNQPAALEEAGGWRMILQWFWANLWWILLLLILIAIGYGLNQYLKNKDSGVKTS